MRGVVKRFGSQTVLDGINLDIRTGETMVIMGGSGSGKSTMLRLMIGSLTPEEGSIELLGRDICSLNEKRMNEVRKRFGILFQSGALFNSMTIAENVALPIIEHTDLDQDIIDIQVKIKLELVGLLHAADKYPAEISGGMKKRAGLARALALDPQLLVLDEPVSALDVSVQAQVLNLLRKLQRELGLTYLFIAHDLAVVENLCDEVAVMYLGRIVEQAPREVLFREPRHPYTHTLLSAVPVPGQARGQRLRLVAPGDASGLTDEGVGCAFAPRCYRAEPRCREELPPLDDAAVGHPVACHFASDTDPKEHAG